MALHRRRCSLVRLLTLAWPSVAAAQIRSATITGTVADATKALVPGATVVVTNQDTNARGELVTSDAGLFTAPYLTAGTYSIEVSLPGFATFRRTGISVATADTVRVAVELAVSRVGEASGSGKPSPLAETRRTGLSVCARSGSGGISHAEIVTPRPFGDAPFNDATSSARMR